MQITTCRSSVGSKQQWPLISKTSWEISSTKTFLFSKSHFLSSTSLCSCYSSSFSRKDCKNESLSQSKNLQERSKTPKSISIKKVILTICILKLDKVKCKVEILLRETIARHLERLRMSEEEARSKVLNVKWQRSSLASAQINLKKDRQWN